MIDLGTSVNVNIGSNVSVEDFIQNPNNHYWEVFFRFPSDEYRNAYATPTGRKYGTSSSFASIYEKLKMPFIESYFSNDYFTSNVRQYGDALLQALNNKIGIDIDRLKTKEGDVYSISKNSNINKTRLTNVLARYTSYENQYEQLQEEMENTVASIRLTQRGTYDRRTRNYHTYVKQIAEAQKMSESLSYLEKRIKTEQLRYENSVQRDSIAKENLNKIKKGTLKDIQSEYHKMAERFAEAVKDDIIGRARSGVLPLQNISLMESTIKKRRYAGIPSVPRFWATGQLINAIQITCTLV